LTSPEFYSSNKAIEEKKDKIQAVIRNNPGKKVQWADSLLSTMTLEQKVGQLFMIATYSNRNEVEYAKIESQIKKYNLGGLIFFQGEPITQALLTNRYQRSATIPLLIGMDAEWGLGMRLEQVFNFPKAITLGATYNPELVEKIGYEIGQQCKRLGVHINFSPDADINSNPRNPVINFRSFGESTKNVSDLSTAYMKGLKKAGIMACGKHFPGHGDTEIDSHRNLPTINHSLDHINLIETLPFKNLINNGIDGIMIGHLNVPALDAEIPASVSEKIIKGYLKNQLKFNGLVITDAMNMRGILKYYPTGKAEVEALKAGNDIILQTANIEVAFSSVLKAYNDSTLNIKDLDHKVLKILNAKQLAGLEQKKEIKTENLINDLNSENAKDLCFKAYESAVTIVKDEESILPFQNLQTLNYATIAIGAEQGNEFQEVMELYGIEKKFTIPFKPTKKSEWEWVSDQAAKFDVVIVSIHQLHNQESKNFGVHDEIVRMLEELNEKTRVVVCVFGNPYSLKFFGENHTLVCGYEDEPQAHRAAANIIMGIKPSKGKVPVNTLSNDAKLNDGVKSLTKLRMGYGSAQELGFDANKLLEINQLVNQSIKNGEFPGCQILLAKKGKVVYHESFGYMRYGFNESVNKNSVYDLASLTKVSATLQGIMILYSQKKIDLNKNLSFYLPELSETNKAAIIIKDLLLHQAGLKAFVPFYQNTLLSNGSYNPDYYEVDSLNLGSYLNITPQLLIKNSIRDSVYNWMNKSALNGKKYVYSDLSLIYLQKIVEKISGRSLDQFLDIFVYQPLGLKNTFFNPFKKLDINRIVPTEIENGYRKSLIRGSVHDPNAALVGGVSGHAGLFSNAWDLATILQMNLNAGIYDNAKFFDSETIKLFSEKHPEALGNRGLGWNKPTDDANVSEFASPESYGHTGFTGTVAWVDPKHDLIFVFLSNRVYPSSDNNKIIKNKTRKKIHDVVYKAMLVK
jgi:beta-glucosidase-like glycosyl hydrolase/CubicO group peptidase (beta-lactamase class C family)